jgi:hypothetical protein
MLFLTVPQIFSGVLKNNAAILPVYQIERVHELPFLLTDGS